jgi:hypothetical protein
MSTSNFSLIPLITPGKLAVRRENVVNPEVVSRATSSTLDFRLIIIPSVVSSNAVLEGSSARNYSIDQLRRMSYREVCRVLGIPE